MGINVIKACVKRCVCPSDPQSAQSNFVHPLSDSFGCVFYRNPAAQYVLPVLDKIFQIVRILNELYDPLQQQKFDSSYCKLLDITDADKSMILGIPVVENPQQLKTASDHVRFYLHNLHDACLHILCNAPFFLRCPPKAYDEIMVFLAGLCPFMLRKLNCIWEIFKSKYGTSVGYEDHLTETEEILEDQLNRVLTREYLSFLVDLLTKQSSCSTESIRAVFVCTAFDSLRWLDTTANIKAILLSELVFDKIMEEGLVQQIQEANYLLQSVLYGIQELVNMNQI
ncbi:uncharacterized protein CEXT_183021 [Caerostris extrusa]|uniref:Exportin-5 C-terminal domain-containing protein n=1 Tax=Caerostris extrusa TaxID=172846 RepID=A0AAV4VYS5_CAEEX|nr:uncharacterized protein CEXT_183021 [Caerostris extrusa]